MGVYITAKLLDQIGLFLGFISGLLLIPEIINFLPLMKFQKSMESQLHKIEDWARFPLKFSPPSWKYMFTAEQREAIEPITAIRTLIFSMVWIAMLVMGTLFSSRFLIVFSFGILIVVALGNIEKHLPLWRRLSVLQLVFIFLLFFSYLR